MAHQRDYSAEYERRIARGRAKGLTRSAARGHAKASDKPAREKPKSVKPDPKLEAAIRQMNGGASLTASAKVAHVSPERLRRFVAANDLGQREGRKWVMADNRPRRVPIIDGSDSRTITVPGFAEASRVARYHNAVRRFINDADENMLRPFDGETVRDVNGADHPLQTDPNALFRFAAKDEPEFHEIYQIVSN